MEYFEGMGYSANNPAAAFYCLFHCGEKRNKLVALLDHEKHPEIPLHKITGFVSLAYGAPARHPLDTESSVMFVLVHGKKQHLFRPQQKNFASLSSHKGCGFAYTVADECFVREMEIVRKYAEKTLPTVLIP
jgi:hypothetical protein